MATLAHEPLAPNAGNERFFLRAAIVMTVMIISAFSLQYLMGRSTFGAPPRVHIHAFFFMGWVAIYLLQNVFAATGRTALHKRLGWIGAVWIVPMVVMGLVVTVAMVRSGFVPFFFHPLQFLVFDSVAVLTFAGLTTAAILMRRRTQWHRRLHFCAMTMLLTPGFGRLLPLPLFQPWSWEVAYAVALLFPLAGMWSDIRRTGRVHAAWHWGVGTIVAAFVLVEAVTYSPVGLTLYRGVTAGSPGAVIDPLGFRPPPQAPLMTGRS